MSLEQYKDSPEYRKIHEQLETLGLIEQTSHLDEYGYTVIPPDLVAPEAFQKRLLAATLDVHERRSGQQIRLDDVASSKLSQDTPLNGHWAILTEDPGVSGSDHEPHCCRHGEVSMWQQRDVE